MKKIFSFIIFSTLLFSNDPLEYGMKIPYTPLIVGGYINAVYDDKATDSFLFNDIALLFSSTQNRFDFLSEVEVSNLNLEGKSNGSSDIQLNFERFQLTYALDDERSIRIGRFNSDIGYWNQAPVNILQETTTAPHMTHHLYPKATLGVSFIEQFNDEDRFSITVQMNKDIGGEDTSLAVDQHLGMAYHGVIDALSWSLSGGFYQEEESKNEALYAGVGMEYEYDRVILKTELFTQKSDTDGQSKPYSAYIQSSWNFRERQNAVMRLEAYKDEVLGTEEVISLLGYVYRPFVNMALKGEFIHHSELPLDRFVASFSVIF